MWVSLGRLQRQAAADLQRVAASLAGIATSSSLADPNETLTVDEAAANVEWFLKRRPGLD